MAQPDAPDSDVIRVPTEQVNAVISLQDILDRVRDGAAARAAQADAAADSQIDPGALDRISELAAQLSDELARLGPLDE